MNKFNLGKVRGEDGKSATIAIGTVRTGQAGSDASVDNVGDSLRAILDFTIPRGDKGDKGERGNEAYYAGSNVQITDGVISATDTTYAPATPSADGLMSKEDKVKLNGIAAGATKNATDAQLRDRATHTGTQAISTVTGLQTSLDSKLDVSEYTASDVLEKLKTVDGDGSGLDADLLDGLHSSDLVLRNSNTPIGENTLNYVAGTTEVNNGGFRVGVGGFQAIRLKNSEDGRQLGVAMHINAFYRPVEGVWGYTAPNKYIPLASLEVRNGGVLLKTHPATGGEGNAHVPHADMTIKSLWDSSDFSPADVSNWNTAYEWGNHTDAGYLTSVSWGDIENLPTTFPTAIGTPVVVATSATVTLTNNQAVYAVNTTVAARTIALPASPASGAQVIIIDYANTFQTNACTVARNGKNIEGAASNLSLHLRGQSVTLLFIDNTVGWKVVAQSKQGDFV